MTTTTTAANEELPRLCLNCRTKVDNFSPKLSPAHQKSYEDFLDKSRINQLPSSALERSQICSFVEDAKNDLKQCDDSIADIEAILAKLKERRVHVLKLVGQGSLLSPVRKLPGEILSEIFKIVVCHEGIKIHNCTLARNSPVFALTWTCSSWRRTALSFAALWADIVLNLNPSSNSVWATDPRDTSNPFLTECLARSRKSPLSLDIYCQPTYLLAPTHANALNAVIKTRRRWHQLAIAGGSEAFRYVRTRLESLASRNSATVFPARLEQLTMYLAADETDGSEASWENPYETEEEREEAVKLLDVLGRGPRLCELTTDYLRYPNHMNLGNVVELSIDRYVGPSLAALLAQCPLLQRLTLGEVVSLGQDSVGDSQSSFSTLSQVRHSHLLELNLQSSGDECQGAWNPVEAPALTTLYIRETGYLPSANPQLADLTAMLVRSRCQLDEVVLCNFEEQSATDFLHSITSELVLDHITGPFGTTRHYRRPTNSAQTD